MSADMVIKFFENYGLIMTILATSGIVFVGALKAIGLFSKLPQKAKKHVYFSCSCIASIISCTVYLYVKKSFVWKDWGMTAACVIGYTISIYGLYENMGLRTLLKKLFFTPIKNLLRSIPSLLFSKSMTEEKILLLAKNLGSDLLLQLANEIRQKEAAAADIRTSEGTQDPTAQTDPEKKSLGSNQGFIKNNFFS